MTKSSDVIEFAIWYDANEHLDVINSCGGSIKDVLDIICTKDQVSHGEISYQILKPGTDRVPLVPRWLETIKDVVPRLLVATTKVVSYSYQGPTGIIGDLDKKDIARLRVITRRTHQKEYPISTPLTDYECDQIIDKFGLEVVMDQLRSSVVH